jgi:thymidine kinase
VAKLYFRYGTMDSAKSMNLLAVAHNYRKQGKQVLLVKPRLDTRFGATKISSRCGLEAEADMMVDADTVLDPRDFAGLDCVLVDEAQFLAPSVIEDLRRITVEPGVPVICYGLRTDFQTKLFPGAQRLMELADRIEEVKVTCQYCAKKAICNLRFVNGSPTVVGPQIQLGADEPPKGISSSDDSGAHYAPVCWAHYDEATKHVVPADRNESGPLHLGVEQSGAVLRPS